MDRIGWVDLRSPIARLALVSPSSVQPTHQASFSFAPWISLGDTLTEPSERHWDEEPFQVIAANPRIP